MRLKINAFNTAVGAQYIHISVVACCLKSLPAIIKKGAETPIRNAWLPEISYQISYLWVKMATINTMTRNTLFSVVIKANDYNYHFVKKERLIHVRQKIIRLHSYSRCTRLRSNGEQKFPNILKQGSQNHARLMFVLKPSQLLCR